MSSYLVSDTSLTSVANAIRTKGGTSAALSFPTGFVTAIQNLPSGGGGGTYQAKTNITPTTSSQTITADSGYDALSSVQINAMPSGSVTAPASISGSSATVSTGTNTLTLTKTVSVTPSVTTAGYVSSGTAGNSSVSLTASVNTRSSSDLSASGATVTAPAGYYGSAATKSVSSGSATAPASISGSSATVSTGTNTLTLTKTVSVTPSVTAGYVSSGTAGNSSVSLTASVTTQAAQTIHPSTTDQSIAASRYLTGAQTIKAVTTSNLTADNIKSGVTVKIGDSTDDDCVTSVTGTYSGGTSKNVQYYSGYASVKNTNYASTSVKLTVAKTGTYKVTWTGWRGSSSGTMGSQLYVESAGQGANETFTGTYGQVVTISSISLTQGQTITVYAKSGSNSRSMYVANLIIEEQTIS